MVESYKEIRIRFPKGMQKAFLQKVKAGLGISNTELAKRANVSVRTLTDWQREKFCMPLTAIQKFKKETGTALPNNIKKLDKFWYVKKGAKKGGITTWEKYGAIGGDPKWRKEKWWEWWEQEGRKKQNPLFRALPVQTPKQSKELAEFAGIMMGDGGISPYQITITLHHKDDKEYARFVIKLITHLFGLNPKIYHSPKKSINTIAVSRVQMVKFCKEKIGLPMGNKIQQKINIPAWIMRNNKFKQACIRGLVDTDGSVFTHQYAVNGKKYRYKKLAFTSASPLLLHSAYKILEENGMHPRIAQNKHIWLDNKKKVEWYFKIIGSHNPKHLRRYKN